MKNIFNKIVMGLLLSVVACTNPEFELPKPENNTQVYKENSLVNKQNPKEEVTEIKENGKLEFILTLGRNVSNDEEVIFKKGQLNKVVDNYNKIKGGVEGYKLLPEEYYNIFEKTIKNGGDTATLEVDIKEYENLEPDNYILPLVVEVDGKEISHLIFVRKDIEYVALSDDSRKPMPPGTYSCSNRTEPMKMVAYVETNDWDIRNIGQFLLKDSKKPVFDIVVLFAANMNYDAKAGRRVLFFNDKLQPIIKDPQKYIKPLTDKGIKVIIDILPNHQGVGYENFQSYEEALDFAMQCKEYTDKLGIDGWDIDEEYARYDVLREKPTIGPQSYLWFMRAMKEVMPDKLLTLYDYGHTLKRTSENELGKKVADYIDYSWSDYGAGGSSMAGIPDERFGQRSVEASRGGFNSYTVENYAKSNLENCYGLFMIFNINGRPIRNGSAQTVLSKATQLFYGEDCEFVGKYHKGPRD